MLQVKIIAIGALTALVIIASLALGLLAQSKPDIDWAASLQSAAKELNVELSDECMAELRAFILERGFDRGAVMVRGVFVRDSNGEYAWLCLAGQRIGSAVEVEGEVEVEGVAGL